MSFQTWGLGFQTSNCYLVSLCVDLLEDLCMLLLLLLHVLGVLLWLFWVVTCCFCCVLAFLQLSWIDPLVLWWVYCFHHHPMQVSFCFLSENHVLWWFAFLNCHKWWMCVFSAIYFELECHFSFFHAFALAFLTKMLLSWILSKEVQFFECYWVHYTDFCSCVK